MLPGLPQGVPELPEDRTVSDYLEVTADNFQQGDMLVAHVTLSVENSWIRDNNIHEWSIQFSRFEEETGLWEPAQATRIGEEADRILYSLVVTQFSIWSVTGSSDPPTVVFQVDDLQISPPSPERGDSVTVTALVTNLVDELAEYTAILWVNSSMSASHSLSLDGEQTATVAFTIQPEPGTYEVRIDRLLGSFTIGGGGMAAIWWVPIGLGSGLALLSSSLLVVWRRRKSAKELVDLLP